MLVLEVRRAFPLGEQLRGSEDVLGETVRVEAELGARERVDEGRDELEERIDEEGDVCYEGATEALRV